MGMSFNLTNLGSLTTPTAIGSSASSFKRRNSSSVSLRSLSQSGSDRARRKIFHQEILDLTSNLFTVGSTIRDDMIYTLSTIGAHLLSMALPITPLAPFGVGGRLRESGTATVFVNNSSFITAKGKRDGSVEVIQSSIINKVQSGYVSGKAKKLTATFGPTRLGMNVSFFREGLLDGKRIDVALWTHEAIYHYEERPNKPAARTPGTGPKYLSIPFFENQHTYAAAIKDVFKYATSSPAYTKSKTHYREIMLKQMSSLRRDRTIGKQVVFFPQNYIAKSFRLVRSRRRRGGLTGDANLILAGLPD